MNIGIVGLDSSHAVMFARFFNDREKGRLGRVTTAWAGGSSDVALSAGRVAEFTRQVREDFGVRILPSINDVVAASDAVLLLSMDGRTHAPQFADICRACESRKNAPPRLYINKPLAAASADALAIATAARQTHITWFSASMLRFVDGLNGNALTARVTCPLWWDDGANAGWFWYGIHGVELLYAAMGSGVARVRVEITNGAETLTLHWHDGRVGTVQGVLNKEAPFSLALENKAAREIAVPADAFEQATANFLDSRTPPPVSNEETLEIMRCVEAANQSRAQGGGFVIL